MGKYYRKPHRYKKKKPLFRKRFLALGTLILIIAGGVFYGLFLWRVFWVEKIIVSGQEKITGEEIEFLVEQKLENKILFFTTKSLLAVDTGQIAKDILRTFPQIALAEVKRSFFDGIDVVIAERTAVALWCANNKYFLLDREGIIFEEVPVDAELIVVENGKSPDELFLGKPVISKKELAQILEISSQLAEGPNISIEKAVLSDERLDIETSEGWEIYFNLKGDLNWQMAELASVLEKQISPEKRKVLEYIDLRFKRVYYK